MDPMIAPLDRRVIALPLPGASRVALRSRFRRPMLAHRYRIDYHESVSSRIGMRARPPLHVRAEKPLLQIRARAPGRINEPDHDFTRHYAPISDLDPVYRALPRLFPSAKSRL